MAVFHLVRYSCRNSFHKRVQKSATMCGSSAHLFNRFVGCVAVGGLLCAASDRPRKKWPGMSTSSSSTSANHGVNGRKFRQHLICAKTVAISSKDRSWVPTVWWRWCLTALTVLSQILPMCGVPGTMKWHHLSWLVVNPRISSVKFNIGFHKISTIIAVDCRWQFPSRNEATKSGEKSLRWRPSDKL